MWYLTGVLKYNLNRDALSTVMLRLKKIGCNPKGYCYPELMRTLTMPAHIKIVQEQ